MSDNANDAREALENLIYALHAQLEDAEEIFAAYETHCGADTLTAQVRAIRQILETADTRGVK